jgi:hypothetical protein
MPPCSEPLARRARRTALGLVLAATAACAAPRLAASAGGLPNLALRTLGGAQLWADVAWSDGWRIQRHAWTGHHRLLDPSNVRRAWGSEAACRSALEREHAPRGGDGHLVILLHGLGRTRGSMSALRDGLEARGFRVAALSYPSTRGSLDEHAASVAQVLDGLADVERVSFVTHSLGGRVVLRLLARDDAWRRRIAVDRVVEIAPPNGGSRLAALARRVPPVAWLLGPSLGEVAEPARCAPPPGLEIAVLAGARGTPRGWNPLLPGDDDGVVGLGETRLAGPHHHRTVRGVHTFLMDDDDVLHATARFLAGGPLEP